MALQKCESKMLIPPVPSAKSMHVPPFMSLCVSGALFVLFGYCQSGAGAGGVKGSAPCCCPGLAAFARSKGSFCCVA